MLFSKTNTPIILKLNLTCFLSISKANPLPLIGYLSRVVVQKEDIWKNSDLLPMFWLVINDT